MYTKIHLFSLIFVIFIVIQFLSINAYSAHIYYSNKVNNYVVFYNQSESIDILKIGNNTEDIYLTYIIKLENEIKIMNKSIKSISLRIFPSSNSSIIKIDTIGSTLILHVKSKILKKILETNNLYYILVNVRSSKITIIFDEINFDDRKLVKVTTILSDINKVYFNPVTKRLIEVKIKMPENALLPIYVDPYTGKAYILQGNGLRSIGYYPLYQVWGASPEGLISRYALEFIAINKVIKENPDIINNIINEVKSNISNEDINLTISKIIQKFINSFKNNLSIYNLVINNCYVKFRYYGIGVSNDFYAGIINGKVDNCRLVHPTQLRDNRSVPIIEFKISNKSEFIDLLIKSIDNNTYDKLLNYIDNDSNFNITNIDVFEFLTSYGYYRVYDSVKIHLPIVVYKNDTHYNIPVIHLLFPVNRSHTSWNDVLGYVPDLVFIAPTEVVTIGGAGVFDELQIVYNFSSLPVPYYDPAKYSHLMNCYFNVYSNYTITFRSLIYDLMFRNGVNISDIPNILNNTIISVIESCGVNINYIVDLWSKIMGGDFVANVTGDTDTHVVSMSYDTASDVGGSGGGGGRWFLFVGVLLVVVGIVGLIVILWRGRRW